MKFSRRQYLRRSSFLVLTGALGVSAEGMFPLEKLPLAYAASGNGAPIGQTIWLQTTNNNNFVSARTDQTNSPLDGSVTQVQAWEEFQ